MSSQTIDKKMVEHVWRMYLTTGKIPDFVGSPWYESKYLRPLVRMLPKDPRCRVCYYPFKGIGGILVRHIIGLVPSKLNPQLCNICEQFANRFEGGVEIELSVLFADVRGSSQLAEKSSPLEFSQLIKRFYSAATEVLFSSNALVGQLMGDAVTGLFVPGFAGTQHAAVALGAAKSILEVTGHGKPAGPWISVGVGVHTGIAFVGAVSSQRGEADITALGHTINTCSRLSSMAGPGEIWISRFACDAAEIDTGNLENRSLQLKGQSEQTAVCIIQYSSQ